MTAEIDRDEIFAWLNISSPQRTPDEITAAIGMSPDRSCRIGDRRLKTAMIERAHCWIIDSGCERGIPVEAQFAAILQRVVPFAEKIRSLSVDCEIEMAYAIYYRTVNPGIRLTHETLAAMHSPGADLVFDLDDHSRTNEV